MNTQHFRVSRFAARLNTSLVVFGSAAILLLAACGGGQAAAPAAPAAPAEATKAPAERVAAGKAAFVKHGCIACHAVDGVPEAIGVVGPNLSKIAVEAKTIITQDDYKKSKGTATSPEAYIRESIVASDAYTYPKCPSGPCAPGLMPLTFKDTIPAAELDALVDFLMSQGR